MVMSVEAMLRAAVIEKGVGGYGPDRGCGCGCESGCHRCPSWSLDIAQHVEQLNVVLMGIEGRLNRNLTGRIEYSTY